MTIIPTRLCCGQRHLGDECPDGLWMCHQCFDRVPPNNIVQPGEDGPNRPMCKPCDATERTIARNQPTRSESTMSKSITVLVTGSRTFNKPFAIEADLNELLRHYDSVTVVHGAAEGADTIASAWVGTMITRLTSDSDKQVHEHGYNADWQNVLGHCKQCPDHQRKRRDGQTYCPAAGPLRNQRMLDNEQVKLVLAYIDQPLEKSKGTVDMVERAKKAKIPVYTTEKWCPPTT
jgi:hypothetical protein